MKSWHPEPFIVSVQHEHEALLLSAVNPTDTSFRRRAPNPVCLKTHFVFPRDGVELWVGEQLCDLVKRQGAMTVAQNAAVFLRYKDAAIGLRIVQATDLDGKPAPIMLVNDGNEFGVMTLTVTHAPQPPTQGVATAAAWARRRGVLSRLK